MADRKLALVTGTAEQEERIRKLIDKVDGGGGPPHDGGMEERVKKLESIAEKTVERLVAIEKDLAIVKATVATKTDLADVKGTLKGDIADAKSGIIMWVVMAIFLAQLLPMLKDWVKETRAAPASEHTQTQAPTPTVAPAAAK